MNTLKKVMLWILGLIIVGVGLWTLWALEIVSISLATWRIIGISAAGVVVLVGIYFLMRWNIHRGIKKDDLEILQSVDTTRAERIWQEEFSKCDAAMIGISIPPGGDKSPNYQNYFTIKDRKRFTDPSKETSDTFFGFNVLIKEGAYKGLHSVIINIDKGEEWIKKNFNSRFSMHKTLDDLKNDLRKYPLSSPKSSRMRLAMFMANADLDEEQVEAIRSVGKLQAEPQVVSVKDTSKKKEHDTPTPVVVNSDEELDDDLEQDIKTYVERKQ